MSSISLNQLMLIISVLLQSLYSIESNDKEEEEVSIGIDLGTTFCVVAYFNPNTNSVEYIEDLDGEHLTPSVVLFDENDIKVGWSAFNDMSDNPNKFWDAKRLIGRNFDDKIIQNDLRMWPFKVEALSSENNKAVFIPKDYKTSLDQVKKIEPSRRIRPEVISAQVLKYLIKGASQKIGKKITSAVITVPAYFDNEPRDATRACGDIADIKVKRIIAEPTSAGIAYGLNSPDSEGKKILILDIGGGTYDVSLLEWSNEILDVSATSGDGHLGGQDFDRILMELFVKSSKLNLNKLSNSEMKILKNESERAKKELTLSTSATMKVTVSGKEHSFTIARSTFEDQLNKKFKQRIIQKIQKVLSKKDSKDKPIRDSNNNLVLEEIDEVVLVGGSSRIPWIQKIVEEFTKKKPQTSMDPDKAIAHGAALYAASLAGIQSEKIQDLVVSDVIPLALGIETAGGVMAPIIEANEKIPIKRSQTFQPASASQSSVSIVVYQGPFKMVNKNTELGRFNLHNIGKNFPAIEVEFSVDADGITTVTAHEKGNNVKDNIKLQGGGTMTAEEKERIMKNFSENDEKDRMESEIIKGKQNIVSTLTRVKDAVKCDKMKKQIEDMLNETNKVTEINKESEEKIKEITAKMQTFMQMAGVGGNAQEKSEEKDDSEDGYDGEDEEMDTEDDEL